ncbi:PREDICTED: uncharacterized protein LOC105117470 isoform X1 [Populus euphratica]|uniref:Uncharacterized protein LOC105117470 isoform X1 n=1 Tax=Populus euphratica TaxID=75702 RepID=A0AAJ6TMG5_POPEU|nr:PREDICTED: uncharacterized protein LOC105117470 isoform X1 [Populus euphratica]
MTIKQRQHIQNISKQKKALVFNEKNENLGEAAEAKSLQMSDVQQNLWKTLRHAAAHQQYVDKHSQFSEQSRQVRKMKYKLACLSDDGQIDNEQVNEESAVDHLLILAQSAELMLESEESFDGLRMNDRSHEGLHISPMAQHSLENLSDAAVTDQKYPGKKFDVMPVIDHVRNKENGFRCDGKTLRLSQIRCLARSKSNILAQQSIGDSTLGQLQGRTRLTQIRHQARSKNHSQVQEGTEKSSVDLHKRIVRLTHIRSLARSKSNLVVQKALQDNRHGHSDCQTSEDDQRFRTIAAIFGEADSFQAGQKIQLGKNDCKNSTYG